MTDWTTGYVSEIGYTYGYYPELNPLHAKLALLNAGYEAPAMANCCELGFGQGISINFHAASNPQVKWYGTDFNPEQANFARQVASLFNCQDRLVDEPFDVFCNRDDLPELEFIALHGIWSWISTENRHIIIDFIKKKLKVGGVLYISYNTYPGWAAAAPLRHVMSQHFERMTSKSEPIGIRIQKALDFTEKLLDAESGYESANPKVKERFVKIKDQEKSYLAHEYLNRDWHPMYFSEVNYLLNNAKVSFACSANYMDHIDAINLSSEQQALLNSIDDIEYKQSTRDIIVNQQFRKDYWIKGGIKLDPLRRAELIRSQKIILVAPRASVPMNINGSRGKATLEESIYGPILDLLADNKVHEIGSLEKSLGSSNLKLTHITEAIIALVGMGYVYNAHEQSVIKASRSNCDQLNREIMLKSRANGDIPYLVSPVTGTGFAIPRFHQLFCLGMISGMKDVVSLANFVWNILSSQNQAIVKEGAPLLTADENRAELVDQAKVFLEQHLPIFKSLQII